MCFSVDYFCILASVFWREEFVNPFFPDGSAAPTKSQPSKTKQKFLFRSFAVAAPESDKKDLLSELEVMKTLKPHPHVIKLIGCVTQSGKLSVNIVYCASNNSFDEAEYDTKNTAFSLT